MKRLIALLGVAAFSTPALAQHAGHGEPAPERTEEAEQDPHAGHTMPATPPDPYAGHEMPVEAPDPHAGHTMPASEPDAHAGHTMLEADGVTQAGGGPHFGQQPTAEQFDPPILPPPPKAFTGPEHAADLYYGDRAMALARREMYRMHGAIPAYLVLVDRLEAKLRDGRDIYELDAEAWYGGDIDKIWFKAEAEGEFGGEFEGAELQALWNHAIGPFFDLQTGLRYDIQPSADRAHFALGVQGLAPYWIEVEATAFLSDRGDLTAQIEAEHDMRITQRLILQPRVEAGLALQDIPDELIGAGLSEIALGARLRYQVTPLVAPYLGFEYDSALGDTRRFRRLAREGADSANFVLGLRFWF